MEKKNQEGGKYKNVFNLKPKNVINEFNVIIKVKQK